jgi:hypothetical protein
MLGIEPLPTAHSQLSPIHILVLVAAGFSLLFAQLPEEAFVPEQWEVICMAQRVSFLLALALLMYHLVVHYWALYEKTLKEGIKAVEASKMDLKGETEMKKDPDSLWVRHLQGCVWGLVNLAWGEY